MSAWDDVRQAIATKMGSAALQTAGIRSVSTKMDDPLTVLPAVRVLQPSYTLRWQTGNTEAFTLDVPFELVVPRPSGTRRSSPIAADLARAIQVEFQSGYRLSGITLGLVSITDARLDSMTPGLSEYDDTDPDGRPLYDGYRGSVTVDIEESVTRSA